MPLNSFGFRIHFYCMYLAKCSLVTRTFAPLLMNVERREQDQPCSKSGHELDTVCIYSHASAPLFPLGWFAEFLATQTLILFIFHRVGNPLRSRPSPPLTITVMLGVGFGMLFRSSFWPHRSALHRYQPCLSSSLPE